jgi:salicylate hydroxylase
VLYWLGLREELEASASIPQAIEARSFDGTLVLREQLGARAASRYGFPHLHVHRADLHAVLTRAATAHPGIELRLGARCSGVSSDSFSASAVLADSGERSDTGPLVGADGIHSVARESLSGTARPRFTGNVAWRALIPVGELPEGKPPPVARTCIGDGAHVVMYYVSGGERLNLVAVVEQAGCEVESWSERGDPAEPRAAFAGWNSTVTGTLAAVDPGTCYCWALLDRAPLPSWCGGRIALLGDACHRTLPFLAQRAAMAIEDAAVLASCITPDVEPTAALRRYEGLRKPRTSKIQRVSRLNARMVHARGPWVGVRNRLLPTVTRITRLADELYTCDALPVAANGHRVKPCKSQIMYDA